jgi:hypothetical protein
MPIYSKGRPGGRPLPGCSGPGQLPPASPLSVLLLTVKPLPPRLSMTLAEQAHGYWALLATVTPLHAAIPPPLLE